MDITAAIIAAKNADGLGIQRPSWPEFSYLDIHSMDAVIRDSRNDEDAGTKWTPFLADLMATDWEVVPKNE